VEREEREVVSKRVVPELLEAQLRNASQRSNGVVAYRSPEKLATPSQCSVFYTAIYSTATASMRKKGTYSSAMVKVEFGG
jgi:hypothetical protein